MNLRIRRFEAEDLQSLYELLSDEEVMRYIEPPFTFEQTRAFLEYSGLTDNPLIYAVEDENCIFIGYVIYHDYEEDSKEIGWILNRRFWGKGLETMGISTDNSIPYLSIYLGHHSLKETERYMKFTTDMFMDQFQKFAVFSDGVFPEVRYDD